VRSYLVAVVTLGALAGTIACSTGRSEIRSSANSNVTSPDNRTPQFVIVRNQNPLDVAVYLLRGGTRLRIGTVTSFNEARIKIPPFAAIDGSTRLLIDPIGSDDVFVTDALRLASDQHAEVTVGRLLQMSTMAIWTPR
jgi:hypothetical protein